ncbi:MAG: T9SS type A sorting domain-containing protein [Candidatus Eisenbacteria bacterium]|nr:T9SS type A sorting domain-containing protein [Candidatus Eisenbacteria bacterium]
MRNTKLMTLAALVVGLSLVAAVSAMAAIEKTPRSPEALRHPSGEIFSANGDVIYTKEGARSDTTWITAHDDTRCDDNLGTPADGGQGNSAPGYATWCWERGYLGGGLYDSCASTTLMPNPGCFTHYDVYTLLVNQWHLDTLDRYNPAVEESTPWCGEWGDTLVWENPYGYGPQYNYSMILNLGRPGTTGFNSGTGFTIGGIHMYDVEIAYDYCYLEYAVSNNETLATWFELDRYNGTSNPEPPIQCPGTGLGRYGCAQYESFQVIGPSVNNTSTNLLVRWRFASDSAWDDEDANGGVWTDGAWRIDHIYAGGKSGGHYPNGGGVETFEAGFGPEWSTPSLPQAQLGGFWSGGKWVNGTPVVCDWWHLELNPDYSNFGNTCEYTNTWMWVADDQAFTQNQEDGYHYRLVTPVFESGPNNPFYDPDPPGPGSENRWTGVVVEFDEYLCIKDIVGDVTDTQCRVYNSSINRWSQWEGDNYVIVGGCQFWNINTFDEWTQYLGPDIDSVQFSWEFLDRCDYNASSELPCMGQHRKATYLIDNVSIGVFEQRGTQWAQGQTERFADTFARDVAMHPMFKENWELFPTDVWEQEDSMTIQVRDIDGVMGGPPPQNSGVRIHWRISTTCGTTWDKEPGRPQGATYFPAANWNSKVMNFSVPDDEDAQGTKAEFNGVYSTIITIADNATYLGAGATLWPEGTMIEYYFTALDSLGTRDTVPNRNAIRRNDLRLVETTVGKQHDRRLPWPFDVRVLPCPTSKDPLPSGQNHPVLLVDGYGRTAYDISTDPNFSQSGVTSFPLVHQIFEESLKRLGVQYDFYRQGYGVSRGNAPIYSQPFHKDSYGGVINHIGAMARRYKTVIWFFGTFSNERTVVDSSQLEIATYLDIAGVNFPDSANIWVLGENLCEDNELTDPAWTRSGNQTTNGAFFWKTLCGLTEKAGGCTDQAGHGGPGEAYRYYLVGQAGTCLAGITKAQGYWDCPIRGHPDDEATTAAATALIKYHDDLGAGKFAASFRRHANGSKAILSFVSLEHFTSAQERDCVVQAVLGRAGDGIGDNLQFNTGIPTPRANCTINVDVPDGVPSIFALRQNVPNPFNPITTIYFDLPKQTKTTLRVYDIAGREVRTLVDGVLNEGPHEATWNGKDNSGRDAASGVYFYRLDAEKDTATRKMVLLR